MTYIAYVLGTFKQRTTQYTAGYILRDTRLELADRIATVAIPIMETSLS